VGRKAASRNQWAVTNQARPRRAASILACAALFGVTGCYAGLSVGSDGDAGDGGTGAGDGGTSDGGTDGTGDPSAPVDPEVLDRVAPSGIRRLTAVEYAATVRDLLDVDVDAALLLPEDPRQPFDNDYRSQVASQALIEGAELLGSDVAALALVPEKRDALVGCVPADDTDEACFRSFVTSFGRRALRRPLTAGEIDRYAGLIAEAEQTGDFYAAVEVALRAFLQHPEFLYRIEIGTPVSDAPGVFRLGDYEMASRLSYFLWGTTPSVAILDRADAGEIRTPDQIADLAHEMLTDERARARVGRFHALWLGYEQLSHGPELSAAMRAETQALIDRVVFDEGLPWQDLLRAEETFVDATLAELYGLPAPANGPAWVDYGDTGRRGLLSQGSFLSAATAVDDTSPIQRGLLIRTRMMCMDIPPPPPGVDIDNTEPEAGQCKDEFYRVTLGQPACAGCHDFMNPIGLGLEQYDNRGAFRTHEKDIPSCEIPGDGAVDGQPFSGPAELSSLLLESGTLNACVTRQLYRFATGRSELAPIDEAFIATLASEIGPADDFDFADLMVRFVTDEAFTLRRDDAEGE
jgi:hypothetical protein